MALVHAGVDTLPADCRVADGLALALDAIGHDLDEMRDSIRAVRALRDK